jgi:hypothetical protein
MAEKYIPQNVLDALPKRFETKTVQTPTGRMGGGFYENQVVVPPPNAIPITAPQFAMGGARDVPTGEYYIPLDIPNYPKTDAQGYPVPPLTAKYDASGNLQTITTQRRYLADGNIAIQPEYNLSGELVSTNAVNNAEGEGGGFGDFLSTAFKDFAPMIALGLGANYLAPLLSGSAGAAAAGGNAGALINAGMGGSAAQAASAAANLAATTAGLDAAVAAGGGLLTGGGANFLSPEVISGAGGAGGTAAATTGATIASQIAAQGATPSLIDQAAKFLNIKPETLASFAPSAIQGLLSAGGSYLQSEQAKEAAETQANAQIRAAQIAADAAKFRPVGVTTRFGSSNFTTDAAGNVIGAGYTPSAEITGYQDRLRTVAGQGMTDIEGARAAYQPLTGAAQSLFGLGQGYLAKTPEQAAQDYISKQQALLAPSQQNRLAEVQNKLFQQGRGGAATAQGGNLMATSPELAAYYNSIAQQDLVLAAQADQEARNRITYGAGLFDTGANLQGRFYTGQTGAYAPFATAMDTSATLERLAERPLTLGTEIGARTTAGTAAGGRFLSEGITSAAQTMAPANAYSGTGNLLAGAANSPNVTGLLNNAFGVQPQQTTSDAEKLRIYNRLFGT